MSGGATDRLPDGRGNETSADAGAAEPSGQPRVTVSIISHSNPDALSRCLRSVARAAAACAGETTVAVIDNCSRDDSVERVRREQPQVEVIAQSLRRGFGANHNTVLRATASEYVLVLNDDTEIDRDCLASLVRFLDEHPAAAIVGPRVLDPAGRPVDSALALPSMIRTVRLASSLGFSNSVQSRGAAPRPVGYVSGCAMLMRRSALDAVGPFDERFFMYREEVDLAKRVQEAGYEVWLLPDAEVTHSGGEATAGYMRERINEAWRSNRRYWHKHHGPATASIEARIRGIVYVARWAGLVVLRGLTGGRASAGQLGLDELACNARAAWFGPCGPGLREVAEAWNRGAGDADARSEDAFDERLSALDTELFRFIYAPGHGRDARSLLALHAAARERHGDFGYLEIGSHLGASLQSFVADPRCRRVVSIDPRPTSQPDDLQGTAYYPDNSTERMLEHLRRVQSADLSKLVTLEASCDELSRSDVGPAPDLCFVDGEHTAKGVLRDARFCREVMGGQGTIAFHDRSIVARGIADFTAELAAADVPFDAYPLPSELFVVELGEPRLLDGWPAVDRRSREAAACWRLISRARGRASAIRALLLGEAGIRRAGRKAKRRARTVVARAPAITRRPGGRD